MQGISTKRMEVFRELERLKIDIAVLTETKSKGQGIEEGKNYLQIYSGVSKDQRAKCGVSLLIKKKYKKCIKEWQYINERIVQVQMRLNGHDVNIIGVYAPNDDADDKQKEKFYRTLGCMMDKNSSRKAVTFFIYIGRWSVQSFFHFLQPIQADARVVTHNYIMIASFHFLSNYA